MVFSVTLKNSYFSCKSKKRALVVYGFLLSTYIYNNDFAKSKVYCLSLSSATSFAYYRYCIWDKGWSLQPSAGALFSKPGEGTKLNILHGFLLPCSRRVSAIMIAATDKLIRLRHHHSNDHKTLFYCAPFLPTSLSVSFFIIKPKKKDYNRQFIECF